MLIEDGRRYVFNFDNKPIEINFVKLKMKKMIDGSVCDYFLWKYHSYTMKEKIKDSEKFLELNHQIYLKVQELLEKLKREK